MATISVQFSDAKQTAIFAYFASPQETTVYQNQAQIDTVDSRYATHYNGLPAQFRLALPAPS
jgi:hypothetical protein